jgi:hypothetical protein
MLVDDVRDPTNLAPQKTTPPRFAKIWCNNMSSGLIQQGMRERYTGSKPATLQGGGGEGSCGQSFAYNTRESEEVKQEGRDGG